MKLDYEILNTSKGMNIAPLIVEVCGSNIDRFYEAYEYASSIIPKKADRLIPKIITATGGNPHIYQNISAKAFEIMSGIAIAQSPEGIKQKYNIKKTSLRYVVKVKDPYCNGMHTRIATDLDICFPKTCVEATVTDDGTLRVSDLQTRNINLEKLYVLQNPNYVIPSQRQKIKKIENSILVLPKQTPLDTNDLSIKSINDMNDIYALEKAIIYIQFLQKKLSLRILKTSEEWNGVKYMPQKMEFTLENLKTLYQTNISNMSLDAAIRMFNGDPDKILMRSKHRKKIKNDYHER